MALPKNARVHRLPKAFKYTHECLTYTRSFTQTASAVVVEQTKVSRCDRVPVSQIKALQKGISAIKTAEQGEVVLRYR